MQAIPAIVPSLKDQVSEDEWKLRCDLAACYRLVAHYGWDDQIFTHISLRLPGDENHFLINPFGLFFEEITASSLIKVDMNGLPVLPSDYLVNPAGFVIHSAIHGAREDAHCVLHTHTKAGIAVSVQPDGLKNMSQISGMVFRDISYHDYEGIALDSAEKERLIPNLGDKNNLILRNHGLLTVGDDVGAAFIRMYLLQKSCEIQLMAQSSGVDIINLTPDVEEKVSVQTKGAMQVANMLNWAALVRKADRDFPDYKI